MVLPTLTAPRAAGNDTPAWTADCLVCRNIPSTTTDKMAKSRSNHALRRGWFSDMFNCLRLLQGRAAKMVYAVWNAQPDLFDVQRPDLLIGQNGTARDAAAIGERRERKPLS